MLLAAFGFVSPCSADPTLTINIVGFETDEGLARIVIFDSASSYEGSSPPFRIASVQIQQARAAWNSNAIPPGTYAAIVHHDRNANNDLDRPVFGLPIEPYGYSNDAFKTFGIPAFNTVKFVVGDGGSTQNISIQYNPLASGAISLRPFRNLIALTLVLILPLVLIHAMRRWLPKWSSDNRLSGKIGLTMLLLMAGAAHLVNADQIILLLPAWAPAPKVLVYATGVLETFLAFALWMPGQTRRTGLAIGLLLIAALPALIYASLNSLPIGGNEIGPVFLIVRVPYQIFLVLWTIWSTGLDKKHPPRDGAKPDGTQRCTILCRDRGAHSSRRL